MDIESLTAGIAPSQSDRILHQLGFDLIREYFGIAEQCFPAADPILELATGTGRMSAVLASLHRSIITGDISVDDLPKVRSRIPLHCDGYVQFMQLDMELLPFRSEGFHTVICINTLHETEQPLECLQEMIRVVNPDGRLIVGDFNRTGFNAMQTIHKTVYGNKHAEGSISTETIKKILADSFEDIQTVLTPLNITYIARLKRRSAMNTKHSPKFLQ